jgi:hypothetical protein
MGEARAHYFCIPVTDRHCVTPASSTIRTLQAMAMVMI